MCDIAAFHYKGRNLVARWLNRGRRDERDDPVFSEQINRLDAEISPRERRQWCNGERGTLVAP